MMGIMLVIMSYVDAESQINFISPVQDSNGLLVKWDNPGSAPGLYLQYKEGDCLPGIWNDLGGPFDGSEIEYLWDTASVNEGEYCLRLTLSSEIYNTKLFVINKTSPATEDNSEDEDLGDEGDNFEGSEENETTLIFSEEENTLQKNTDYKFTIKNKEHKLRVKKIGEVIGNS